MKLVWILIVLGVVTVATTVTVFVLVAIADVNEEIDGKEVITTSPEEVQRKDEEAEKRRRDDDSEKLFQLSIIHINDLHARFEETNERSMPCQKGEKCIAGFARMKTVVDQLMRKRENAIFLNAGDNFQGTFWYNLLRYNVTSYFLNLLQSDAITLGNHEFAHRIEGLVPFLQMLNSPVVVCNIDDHHEPSMKNLIKKSHIVERGGRRIGIIGVILRETSEIANTGRLIFKDEVASIRNEATRLRQQGINIIIVLSHCGLDRDREIALETGDFVDIIVGGHSHSFLYTSIDKHSPGPDSPVGTYPIVITPKSGSDRKVLIVQASSFSKFVGDLTVYFNAAGHVKYYEGNPIFASHDIEKDVEIEKALRPWRREVNRLGQRMVGNSSVKLVHEECRHGECALGSFAADAFVYETLVDYPELHAFASIIQAAGMRSSYKIGDITYGDIVAFMPFENTLDVLQLRGDVLIDVFEHSVSRSFTVDEFIGIHMLQVSGFQLTFNITKPVGQRLQAIQIRSNAAGNYENINPHKQYSVIIPSFIAGGGDGFTMIKTNRKNHRVGLLDIDIIEKFIEKNSPISTTVDGRIVMLS